MSENGHFNALAILGDVVGQDKDLLVIRTSETTPKGTFHEDHLIHMGALKIPKAGRVEVLGHLEMIDKDPAIVADNVRSAEDEDHVNEVHLIGDAYRTVQYFPPTEPGQVGFANVVVRIGELLVQGKTWRGFAAAISKVCTQGSLTQLYGRMQQRSFTDKDGEERTAVEIVCNENLTKVLESRKIVSRFASMKPGYGTSKGNQAQNQAAVTMAIMQKPAPATAKPKQSKPEKAI